MARRFGRLEARRNDPATSDEPAEEGLADDIDETPAPEEPVAEEAPAAAAPPPAVDASWPALFNKCAPYEASADHRAFVREAVGGAAIIGHHEHRGKRVIVTSHGRIITVNP